ncbi:MAG TPA: NlpC/P60 family protein, partial [Thermoleophilia bacterium]|nr:NlpC/P60 family protein [Thermoleophilia bacterium]
MRTVPDIQSRHCRRRRPAPAVLVACLLAGCVLAAGLLSAGPSRAANPTVIVATKQPTTLPELQRSADQVQKQVAALDDRLEVVVEDWDQAESRLAAIQAQLGTVRLQLAQQQDDLARQQAVLGSHLAWLYKMGDYGLLDELLSGGSLNDAAARIEFLKRLNQQDRQLRDGFVATVKQIDTLQDAIARKRDQAMLVQQQADAERATISDKLAERQAILDGLNGRIKKIIDERTRREELAAGRLGRAALAQIGAIHGTAAQVGVVRDALRFLGVPYVWGGASPSGFDCSGLVLYVYARYSVSFPHFAAFQAEMGTPVPESQLEPADLVFFGSPIHHVVIYAGNGLVVQA